MKLEEWKKAVVHLEAAADEATFEERMASPLLVGRDLLAKAEAAASPGVWRFGRCPSAIGVNGDVEGHVRGIPDTQAA